MDAAKEKADTYAFFALSRSDGGNGFHRLCGRKKLVHGGERFGQDFQSAESADSGLQAGFLVGEQRPTQELETAGLRERFEEKPTVELVEGRSRVVPLNLRAGSLDQFAVVHARGAGGHAGNTTETSVEVMDPVFLDAGGAFEGPFHQINTAARRIHFFAPENVGWASRQAKAAVNTFLDEFQRRRLMRIEGTGLAGFMLAGRHGLDASDEAARVESSFGIELGFYGTHERKSVARGAPSIEIRAEDGIAESND